MAEHHERMSGGTGEHAGTAMESIEESRERMEECVSRNPGSAVLVSFLGGFGLGLVLGMALGEPPRPRRSAVTQQTQRIRRQVMDALAQILPEDVASRLHL